ncbi:hypothetical protein BGZ63DRAFT_194275 [Mariannaea sp. PMI_226]|nr:hypothetical protein BGZ63DRAFT_194275 [Mariannaea sp. PMI_226]
MIYQRLSSGILLIAGFLSSHVAGQVTCVPQDGPNLFYDPSFENRDANDWTIITGVGVNRYTSADHSDGSWSAQFGNTEDNLLFQGVWFVIEVGATYNVKFDYKPFYPSTSPQPSSPQQCDINVKYFQPVDTVMSTIRYIYNAGDEPTWQTITGSFEAQAANINVGIAVDCRIAGNDASFFTDFRVFIDNASMVKVGEVCTTATTTTSEATSTTSAEATTTTVPGKCGPKKQVIL